MRQRTKCATPRLNALEVSRRLRAQNFLQGVVFESDFEKAVVGVALISACPGRSIKGGLRRSCWRCGGRVVWSRRHDEENRPTAGPPELTA